MAPWVHETTTRLAWALWAAARSETLPVRLPRSFEKSSCYQGHFKQIMFAILDHGGGLHRTLQDLAHFAGHVHAGVQQAFQCSKGHWSV